MRATLYVFAYAGLSGATHLAVTREARDWPELIHGVVQDDALIERSRSKAASHFLHDRDAGDVMLMVDHDLSWRRGDLRHLADRAGETRGIVAGLYPKRTFHGGMTFRIEEPCRFEAGEDRLIPATYVPTGFMAIHRRVVEHVAAGMRPVVQGFYPLFLPMVAETPHGLEHLSEDWAFCERARPLPVHLDAYPRLRHEGTYQYRLLDSQIAVPDEDGLTLEITHDGARVVARDAYR